MTTTLTRRGLVAAASAAAAAPLAIAGSSLSQASVSGEASAFSAKTPAGATTIGRLWAEAEELRHHLDGHRAAIADAAQAGGISGWMRLGGEANRIGEARYGKLVAVLKAEPEAASDLALMGRAALEDDIRSGAFGWAGERLAHATVTFHGSALA